MCLGEILGAGVVDGGSRSIGLKMVEDRCMYGRVMKGEAC